MASKPPPSLSYALLCLVAVAVLPAYVLLSYIAIEIHDRSAITARENAGRISRMLAREQEKVFREARELVQLLASVPALTDPSKVDFCKRFLANIHKALPRYGNLGIASADGNITCSALPLPKAVNISDRTYFKRTFETGQFSVGDYVVGRVSGRPSITVGLPMFGQDRRVNGVMFAAIDLAWLREALLYADIPSQSIVRLIDKNGILLADHPSSNSAGTRLSDSSLLAALKRFAGHPVDWNKQRPAIWSGEDQVHAIYPISDDAWHPAFVWTALSRTPDVAEIESYFKRFLLAIGLATLLVFVLAWFFGRRLVVDNIRAVADAARRFAEGDLSARAALKQAPAEISGLGTAFDSMAEGVALREHRILEISGELTRSNRILRTLSGSNRTLLRAADEDQLLHDMCRVATETGGFRAAWVGYRENDESQMIRRVAQAGLESGFFEGLNLSWGDNPRGQSICARAIRHGQIFSAARVLEEAGSQPWWELMSRYGIQSAIALPLRVNGETIGVMALYATEVDAFADQDLELLDELAADLSFGIETIRARNEHERTAKALRHLALHDPGSGLPNQLQLRQWLEQVMQNARLEHYPVSLFSINLPRLREISDILGPRNVNQCLERIAREIREVAGKDALIAREGSFTLAVARPKLDLPGATRMASRLGSAVRRPFDMGSCSMELESWIGIAVFPGHATDPDALVGRASLAAQHAQSTGRHSAILESNPEEAALKRLTLLSELRVAVDRDELSVHYQPKVAARTGEVVGAEALVRWNHPKRGMISPAEFIPLAEQTGLIRPVTALVLRSVTRQIHGWQREHSLSIPVAVNLSAQSLQDAELASQIDGLVGTWGLERSLLQLEITESTLMRDPEEALKMLRQFSASGMSLFIDDFGTGYSSLAYLASLPVNALKIDRSFVNQMTRDHQHRGIVHAILSLAATLNLKVVAEGVETEEQAEILRSLSCDELQGYLFSRPLPPEEFIEWLQRKTN